MAQEPNQMEIDLQELLCGGMPHCACGREHPVPDTDILTENGALMRLPERLRRLGVTKPYLVMDGNTRKAAGHRTMCLLNGAGICFHTCCLNAAPRPQADMATLEILARGMENDCDFVLGIGSGVLNDLCKMLGKQKGLRTGIIATAPSMDGYASNSSAMILEGVKTTVYNQTPALVLCDLEVLQGAPRAMRGAGIGDMAAKAVSIAEWRISRLVTGEYYCGAIAEMMLGAYRQAVTDAAAVMRGEAQAVRGLTEGLALSGIASSMAQVSRPASGSEHTLSHLMDMLAIARGTEHQLHGVQVGYGVRVALAAYEALLQLDDPASAAGDVVHQHHQAAWERDMRRVFGAQAEALIRDAAQEGRQHGKSPAGALGGGSGALAGDPWNTAGGYTAEAADAGRAGCRRDSPATPAAAAGAERGGCAGYLCPRQGPAQPLYFPRDGVRPGPDAVDEKAADGRTRHC